jgi:hypothetical protein
MDKGSKQAVWGCPEGQQSYFQVTQSEFLNTNFMGAQLGNV